MKSVNACHETAQAFEVIDNQCDRTEDCGECPGRLHSPADFHLTRQDRLGKNDAGQYHRELIKAALKYIERPLLLDQSRKVSDYFAKLAVDLSTLLCFTPVKRNRFSVLAQAHQAKAEIGLAS